ncbi:MAG: aldehyde dehydrogenase [Acidimicrobiales bacterium]|jgi:aldehyde dehydrogenase (NAD+)|nr:aldehyde dehydrogenase [Acidimicrobiales bacterium]
MAELRGEERLLIGGELVGASDGSTYPVVNPATESVLGVAADAGAADCDAAVAAARAAFDATDWSTNLELRVRCLRQLHAALERNAEELRATIVAEVGCPVMLTHSAQLDIPVSGVGWVADLAERYQWETDLGVLDLFGIPARRTLRREAAGVVAAITPWNFPMQINLAKVAPALAAGCTAVLKPAPDTPWTAAVLGRIVAEETDLPPGVVNIVTSSRNEIGQQLAEDMRVDVVSFTGSTATGRKVMVAGATNLKRVFLELGGKSASVVLDDADLGSALGNAAFQITTNAGQGCAITTRLLVPRSRYDEALDSLVGILGTFPYGDPTDPGNLMGPLISERQRQRVLGYIETGVREGARLAMGGGVPEHLPTGFYVEPTVLADVDPDATVAQEEIFGPVLAVIPYDGGDDEAVAIANNSVYGLSGAVFSASPERARAVANRIRTGTLAVNGAPYYGPDAPFGGYKQSGIGREMGVLGFEEYLEAKTLAEPA